MRIIDLKGQRFGRLIVVERTDDLIGSTGVHRTNLKCICDCGNETTATANLLRSGQKRSCGCLQREILIKNNRLRHKTNIYDLSGEVGIGFTSNTNEVFYFDKEDFEKIKDICWSTHFITANRQKKLEGFDSSKGKLVTMHECLGFKYYDHIDRNEFNNQKSNLRKCTQMENARNRSLGKNNTSGITGVSYHKKSKKWIAYITVNRKRIWLGEYSNKEDAIRNRLIAEKKYYKEFAPQKDLYKIYNIE